MVNNKGTTIAIVGVGASGVACFTQLVAKYIISKKTAPLCICVFEKRDEFGPGLAYGTGQEGHLLNTRAGLMGIFPEEPLHFVQWVHQHREMIENRFGPHRIHPDAYPPRMLYGCYVQAVMKHYWREAERHGITLKKERSEVLRAEIGDNARVTLHTRDGSHVADYVILATGNPKSNNFTHLNGFREYLDSPWPSANILSAVRDKHARIGIVGSSLTAIDAMITLVENGHRGPISFFSSEGLLPRVQPPVERHYERRVFTLSAVRRLIREQQRALRVKDLIRLFRAEVEQHLGHRVDWAAEVRTNKAPLELLNADIRNALGGGSLFQDILYALRYESYPIWQLLPVEQQQLYAKWIKTEVDINRHAIPVENAMKLKNLLERQQLRVIGNSGDIRREGNGFALKTDDGQAYHADFVINATGPAVAIRQMDDLPLLQQLLAGGYIEEYAAGGLVADLCTLRVSRPTAGPAPFYAIGHLLVGLQHDVNALWFNVAQADKLTTDLVRRLP